MPKTRVCDQHVVEDIGRVADVGHCVGAEGGKRLIWARTGYLSRIEQVSVLMQGEYVCKDLRGVPEGREGIKHGHGRIFCEFLRGCLYCEECELDELTSISSWSPTRAKMP